jgi:hypothetical protein
MTSSIKVFHCSHEGHLPNHLRDSYPQFEQKNAVLTDDFIKKISSRGENRRYV